MQNTDVSKKWRLLVADDSITIQKLVNVTFAGEQFEVITALDGFDAGTKVRRLKPDIVLVDTHLREITGAQLVIEIRKDTSLLNTKVILLKGNLSEDERAALIGLPADLVLEKPFDSRKLAEAVKSLIRAEDSTHRVQNYRSEEDQTVTQKMPTLESSVQTSVQESTEAAAQIQGPFSSFRENDDKSSRLSNRLKEIAAEIGAEAPAFDAEKTQETEAPNIQTIETRLQEVPSEIQKELPDLEPTQPAQSFGLSRSDLESIAREEIRAWLQMEMPKIGEKYLKEAIFKISEDQ